jgi:cytochrome c-type biogenesis protein CcmF
MITNARAAILGQFALVSVASVTLIYALIATDFSIKYVAMNTTRATPIYYRVTGLWGALEGSLLLWEWILIIFSGLLAWVYRIERDAGEIASPPVITLPAGE